MFGGHVRLLSVPMIRHSLPGLVVRQRNTAPIGVLSSNLGASLRLRDHGHTARTPRPSAEGERVWADPVLGR
jgi:hypothetical protein